MQNSWAIQVVTIIFMAMISISVIIIISICQHNDEQDNKKSARVLNKPVQCQFCDKYIYFPLWFGHDWACSECWDEYGLDGVLGHTEKSPWLIAEIKIEELECDDNL